MRRRTVDVVGIGTWKDLCIDAVDAVRLGEFWSTVLGLRYEQRADGQVLLSGAGPEQRVWVNTVPEPVTTKQRVHLDVHAASVEDVLALGAVPEELESFSWKVLRDPEGGELCVFERHEVPDYRLYELVVDAPADPGPIATWWADILGGRAGHDETSPWWWVEEVPGMPFESIVFPPVPEPKIVKNRIHWDIWGDPERLVSAGATLLREKGQGGIGWTVLADPAGNEFCAFEQVG